MNKELIELCQYQALAQVLVDWNDLPYEKVIARLEDKDWDFSEDEDITVWEMYEDWDGSNLTEHISDIYEAFELVAKTALEKN